MQFMNLKMFLALLVIVLAVAAAFYFKPWDKNSTDDIKASELLMENKTEDKNMSGRETKNPQVTAKTNMGEIVLELYMDKTPITSGNFIKLAKAGFYDGTKFHRVIDGFMIQGGDPESKGNDTSLYGRGGPGYTIQDEFVNGLSNVRGTISMANTGEPNSGGSQFFINLIDNTGLDFDKPPFTSSHPVFGRVLAGMDVVDAIAKTATGSGDIPINPVIIEKILIQ